MFKVRHAEETINKTFRMPKSLFNKMSAIAQKEHISLNNFLIQCCEYAINNIQQANDK